MILTSKLITCFIDSFTSGLKYQSVSYLLSGNAHIYGILDLEGEVHSIWHLWKSRMPEQCFFLKLGGGWATTFGRVHNILDFL
jgi:hypothetical protein